MKKRARGIFSWLEPKNGSSSSENNDPEEAIVGKQLSLDIFRHELSNLGYDFEIFTDTTGKIYRFRRILPKNDDPNGDVW